MCLFPCQGLTSAVAAQQQQLAALAQLLIEAGGATQPPLPPSSAAATATSCSGSAASGGRGGGGAALAPLLVGLLPRYRTLVGAALQASAPLSVTGLLRRYYTAKLRELCDVVGVGGGVGGSDGDGDAPMGGGEGGGGCGGQLLDGAGGFMGLSSRCARQQRPRMQVQLCRALPTSTCACSRGNEPTRALPLTQMQPRHAALCSCGSASLPSKALAHQREGPAPTTRTCYSLLAKQQP